MAGEWIETVLQEIAANDDRAFAMGPFGSNIRSENYRESGVPVIRGTNLGERGEAPFIADDFVFLDEEKADNLASSNCSPNDIVFVAQGTVGKVGIVPSDTPYRRFVLSQNLMKVTVDLKRVDPRFVFYFYRSSVGQHEIMSRVNPTGVPCISKPLTSLRQFCIRLPSDVNEQRAIAHILGTLDDKIELNRRMNETLEAMARALFKSWFVNFDPVRAKMEGRDPGLPKHLADLFPDSFEGSELGEIPKGWRVAAISELTEINAWTLGKTDTLDRIEYVEISEVTFGNIGTIQVFDRGEEPSRARRRLRDGDTALSTVRPERGSYFLCLNPSPSLVASTGFAVVSPTKAPWSFVHAALTRPEVFEQLGQLADGGAYPAVRTEAIVQLQVAWPNQPVVIDSFHQGGGPLYARAEQNRSESRSLAALRAALLPKLVTGELRVKNRGGFVEAQA